MRCIICFIKGVAELKSNKLIALTEYILYCTITRSTFSNCSRVKNKIHLSTTPAYITSSNGPILKVWILLLVEDSVNYD